MNPLRFVPEARVEPVWMPESHAIDALRETLGANPDSIETFFADHEFPLPEPPCYTFVYRGPAESVNLRSWIFGLPTCQPLVQLEGTDVWYRTLEIPDDSRVEYKFEVLRGGQAEWIEDPLNPQHAGDPFGGNSVLTARGYEEPVWAEHDPAVPAGRIEPQTIPSEHLGGERRFAVYVPALYRPRRRYPLLVVHDGLDYVEYSSLGTVLDNLIHRLEIPPLIVALTQPEDRLTEYAAHEPHSRFLLEELIPRLETDYPTLGAPDARGLMGASLGAVASFASAHAAPDFFGKLFLQSGSFAFTDIGDNERGPAFEPIVEFMNRYRREPVRVADKVYLSVGRYESLVHENRALVPVLRSTGMKIQYREARDGHNWQNWRDRLRDGLTWLFPGPLWMVYE